MSNRSKNYKNRECPAFGNTLLGAVLLTDLNKMGKAIRNVFKTDTLTLTECTDGYYLWDKVAGYNITIHAKNEQQALIEGIEYYQRYHSKLQKEHKELSDKVDSFLSQFERDDY